MAIFKRLQDGETLEYKKVGFSMDTFGVQFQNDSVTGKYGESINVLHDLDEKDFFITFLGNDVTGEQYNTIKRFFCSSPGWFKVTDAKWGLKDFMFRVSTGVDVGVKTVISCTAKYGDFLSADVTQLFSVDIPAGGDFNGWSGEFINDSDVHATFELSITPNSLARFRAGCWIGFGYNPKKVLFYIGEYDNYKLNSYNGTEFVADSFSYIGVGHGSLRPASKQTIVYPGERVVAACDKIVEPFESPIAYNVTYRAIAKKQES